MASVVDPLQGAAKILEILERILPKCIDYCKNMKLYPNDRKIILDLKVVEQEIGCLDDEQKRLYPERLAGIERACKRVADAQNALSRMDLQSFWQKWSKEHREIIRMAKQHSRQAKRMAIRTSQDAKTHKALQTAQAKDAIETLEDIATRQGVDPQKLVHAVQEHAREERQVINNYYITGSCNVTINQQSAAQHPERYIRPEQQRTAQSSTSRKSKVHVVPKRPVFSGPVRPRKKAPKEIVDLAGVLVRAMNAPPITQPETTRRR